MGKPYSDLEKRAIALISVQPNYEQWPDVELKQYWEWKIRADMAAHDLPAASERPEGRKLDSVSLLPFGATLPAKLFAKASISKRSLAQQNSQGLSAAILGHKTPAADETVIRIGKFRPARVYYRTGDATEAVTRTSRITKRKYKSYYAPSDQGFSFPFGKPAATDTEGGRQTAIRTAIGNDINLVTFSPEKLVL